LVLAVVAIAVWRFQVGRPELMVLAVVPGALALPVMIAYLFAAYFGVIQQQRQGMFDLAKRWGFRYRAGHPKGLDADLAGFYLLDKSTHLLEEIRGERAGIPLRVLNIRNGDSDGEGSGYSFYTVAFLPGQLTDCPDFLVLPHSILRPHEEPRIRVEGSLVRDAFSQHFTLRAAHCEHEQTIRGIFDDSLVNWFLKHTSLCLQVSGGSLWVWQGSSVAREVQRAFKSVRVKAAEDAESVARQALEVLSALQERTRK
jgi:hypothetical protein